MRRCPRDGGGSGDRSLRSGDDLAGVGRDGIRRRLVERRTRHGGRGVRSEREGRVRPGCRGIRDGHGSRESHGRQDACGDATGDDRGAPTGTTFDVSLVSAGRRGRRAGAHRFGFRISRSRHRIDALQPFCGYKTLILHVLSGRYLNVTWTRASARPSRRVRHPPSSASLTTLCPVGKSRRSERHQDAVEIARAVVLRPVIDKDRAPD